MELEKQFCIPKELISIDTIGRGEMVQIEYSCCIALKALPTLPNVGDIFKKILINTRLE
jgi:hypothetical protein